MSKLDPLAMLPVPDLAECGVLIAGAAVLIALFVQHSRRRPRRRLFFLAGPLPPAREPDFPGAPRGGIALGDVLVPMLWYFGTQLVLVFALRAAGLAPPPDNDAAPRAVASSPATRRASDGTDVRLPLPVATVVNIALQIVTVGACVWVVRRVTQGRLGLWGLRGNRLGRDAFAGLAGYLASWPAVFAVAWLSNAIWTAAHPTLEPPQHSAIQMLKDPATPAWAVVAAVVSAALFAPLAEELFFRGLVQNFVARVSGSMRIGVGVAAALFACIHVEPQNIAALAVLGVVLGYVYARTRSLTAAVFLHATFNVKTLVFLFLFER